MDANMCEITPEKLKKILYDMLYIRAVQEEIARLYPEEEMRCPVHLSIGQEAIAVGTCANLSRDDFVLSNHRSHAHYLAKGGNLKKMLAEIYGRQTGCCNGKSGSMHLIDNSQGFLGGVPIVGSSIPIATGVAFGTKLRKMGNITTIFFGDGTVEEGSLHESLNFASLKQLPIIFVCENNFFSVYSPLSVRQPKNREIYSLAEGHGITSFQGDGNNVLEVFQLMKKAIEIIKNGQGPVFLEFTTYRWREHCGPYYDNNLGYRTEEEFNAWKLKCPIETFTSKLLSSGIIDTEIIRDMKKEIMGTVEESFKFAKQSPFPDKDSLMKDVYRS
jgi:TPP-dependent pyruvate/acetoin dehydrogenase alpha subunit